MKKSGRKQGVFTLFFSVLLAITVIVTSIMPVSAKQSQMTMTKEVGSKVTITLHYYRFDNKYDDWDIWAWAPEGVAFALDSQDEFGKKGTIAFENVSEETPIGFIVRKSDWSQKEGNADRFVDKSKLKSDGTGDIYVIEGIDTVYTTLASAQKAIADNSGVSKENKGKYAGVWEADTTVPNTDVKTGISHLKELGVTTVHLLPSFDHQSIDETKLEEAQYNWGYDPKNYNVPEGSYSSDPYDGKTRITEYKKMVQELHKAGISVVMDVVYNHTGATSDSELNKAVPNYYYRQNEKGEFSNGSGCGNETASERAMMRKLMVDSVTYWAKEYHVDGFRFDLMALHDQDTMVAIREALNEINPSILIYGEGWTGGDTPLNSEKQATKANTKNFGELQIAAFSDDIRDGIKGSVFDAKDHGFVDGAQNKEETIKFGIVASTPNDQIDTDKVNNQTKAWAKEPYQTITYESAHDNLTLWDKLQSANETATEQQLLAMNKMSAAIVLTSQGIPFLHAGEEMARTKVNPDGTLNENSYNAPDSVNAIDWSRKQKYEDLYEYYQGLIAMRKEHKAFHMNSTKEIQNNLKFLDVTEKNVVAYTLNGKAVGDSWNTIAVIFNANNKSVDVTIPDNQWAVVVDQNTAGTKQLKTVSGSTVTVPANSTYVLVDKVSIDTVK